MKVRTSEFDITEAMLKYGGGFVQQLARCLRAADESNKRKLVETFPEYLTQYDEIAAGMREREGKAL